MMLVYSVVIACATYIHMNDFCAMTTHLMHRE